MNKQVLNSLQVILNDMWIEISRQWDKHVSKVTFAPRKLKGRRQNFILSQSPRFETVVEVWAETETKKVYAGSINLIQGSRFASSILYSLISFYYTSGFYNSEYNPAGVFFK